MITGQGKMQETAQGAKREANDGRGRFDLLPYESLEALAKWSEAGAEKYGDRNWEKGLSVKDCINRMLRHAIKAANGYTDEDHLAAVMWNASAAITMMQRRPDCNDHPWKPTREDILTKSQNVIAVGADTDVVFFTREDFPGLTQSTVDHINQVTLKKYQTRAHFVPEDSGSRPKSF